MVTKELVVYIRDQLQLSVGEIIRENLRSHGWKEEDIDDAFRTALLETPYAAAPVPKKHSRKIFYFLIILVALLIPLIIGLYAYLGKQLVSNEKKDQVPITAVPPTPTDILPVSGFSDVTLKVRDIERKSDLDKIASSLEEYKAENGRYPDLLSDLNDSSLPKDPQTDESYEYSVKQNGQDYELCAIFETTGRQCVSSIVEVTSLP